MGRVVKLMTEREQAPEDRQEVTRLVVELSENVHVHFRDLRIEMSVYEWQEFARHIVKCDELIRYAVASGYREGTSEHHAWRQDVTDRPAYWPSRVRLEENANGSVHLHWHELRLEMSLLVFEQLRADMRRAEPGRLIYLSDLMIRRWIRGAFERVPLRRSGFYDALYRNDRDAYESYRSLVNGRPGSSGSCIGWSEFLALRESVHAGWRADSCLVLEEDGLTIADGQHRASILLCAYPNLQVRVSGNRAWPCLPYSQMKYPEREDVL